MTPRAIAELAPGARFQLEALPDRRGVLLRLGEGAALVRYDAHQSVRLPDGRSFDARTGEAVTISLETRVIPDVASDLPTGENDADHQE